MAKIGRRRWVAGAVGSGVLAAMGCGGASSPPTISPVAITPATITSGRARVRVVIVGAGIAGLSLAHRLLARGLEPLVLEATDRVGGRIRTVREPFSPGVYAEAGAMHVLADPSLVALADEVGAERVIPPRLPPSRRVLVREGVRSVLDVGVMPPDPDPLPGEEAALEGMLAWARALGPSNVTGDPSRADWIDAARASLDGLSLEAAVQREGASAALARAMARDLGMGASASELSALWIAQQAASIGVERTWASAAGRFRGGTDRFPEAVAARLGERVVRGAIVREIVASAEGVRVRFERAGANEEIAAERVVVAVHAPVVREIRFEPGLIAQAHLALDAIRTASVVRAWAELDRPVWQDEGVEGAAYSDGPFGDLRTLADLGSPDVLGTYVSGEGARTLAALAPEERTRQLVEHVCAVHPGARDHVRGTFVHAWDEDPYARGAYVWMPVGVLTGALPAFEAPMPPSHRVHFAGDWCSHRPGFMHGAIASADRVLAEIERAG